MHSIGKDKFYTQMAMKDGNVMKLIRDRYSWKKGFRPITLPIIENIQRVIVALDITNRPTFENVVKWLNEI